MARRAFVLACPLVLLAGCNFGPQPKDVVSKYLDASLHGRFDEAHSCLSSKDRAYKPLDAYKADGEGGPGAPLMKAFAKKVSFAIKDSKVNGDRATVVASVTTPDLSSLATDLMGMAFASALGGKRDSGEIEAAVASKLAGKEVPTVTQDQTFALVKERDGWRISLNLETKARVADAMKAAAQLEAKRRFEEAKGKYQDVLRLEPAHKEAGAKLKELGAKIAAVKEQESYFDKIEIRGLGVTRGTGFTAGYVFLSGEVKNLGERTLDGLELLVHCLDESGKSVFETADTVLTVPKGDAGLLLSLPGDFSKPLKPNYSRKFTVDLKEAPSDWKGKVDVRVVGLEFSVD